MRDIDAIVATIHEIEVILAEHIAPEHPKDARFTVDRIFLTLDKHDAGAAADRLEAGFGVLQVVK